jgi:subtilisin family serine protease
LIGLKIKQHITLLTLTCLLAFFATTMTAQTNNENATSDLLVLKIRNQKSIDPGSRVAISKDVQLRAIRSLSHCTDVHQAFSGMSSSALRNAANDLSDIYYITLPAGSNLPETLAKIRQSGLVEYVEPLPEHPLLYIPNDPEAHPDNGLQDYLSVIKAYDAWDIEKSDTSLVIGIVDTGVELSHEDLQNIAINYSDPINGQDDDGDGYIDNYHGWDMADADNDPTADGDGHGSFVTGLSSALVNNDIGIAGVGFNSRYLPIKTARSGSRSISKGYDGIVYAADHGVDVINLSWGNAGSFSHYAQDIINYAVLEKDVVLVAAAGNTNEQLNFYPASQDHVLSIGATDINDNKASFATYSHFIDVMAPGEPVYTTNNSGGYEFSSGSSFSSALVSGAATLVRARFPTLNAIQVMEQLRVTADDIYGVGQNQAYDGMLGKGRLNIRRALSNILTPAVRLDNWSYEGSNGDLVFAGDTVSVDLAFTNYLRMAENLTITLSYMNESTVLQSEDLYVSSLATFESFRNDDNPLIFVVSEDAEPGENLSFRVDYLGNYYTDFENFDIVVTPNYFDVSDGKLSTTVSSGGNIGFNDEQYNEGNGTSFSGRWLATDCGFIVSYDSAHVMDNVINDFDASTKDQDFHPEVPIRLHRNSEAHTDARSIYKPIEDAPGALPLRIEQKILGWNHDKNEGFLVFEYRIINIGDTAISGLNAGIFADWDLATSAQNQVETDESNKLGFAYYKPAEIVYAGLALLSEQPFSHYAIDLKSNDGNVAELEGTFPDERKHHFLSGGEIKYNAGVEGGGNDIAQVLGARGFDLQPRQKTTVTIAMLASSTRQGLLNALTEAKARYQEYYENPPRGGTYYACLGENAVIDPPGEIYEFYSDAALTNRLDSSSQFVTPPVQDVSTYYAVNLDSGYYGAVEQLTVRPGTPQAGFEWDSDTLLIERGKAGLLKVTNTSILGDSFQWDFDNGYGSTAEHPQTSYGYPGLYDIEMIASNKYGCLDTTTKQLFVGVRSESPEVIDQQVCKNANAIIAAVNTDEIRVYQDPEGSSPLFEGASFESGSLSSDTVFYISNIKGEFESVIVPVNITITAPAMGLQYAIDTVDLDRKNVIRISNADGPVDSLYWYLDESLIGRNANIAYEFSTTPFEVMQVKIDQLGCSDTLQQTIVPSVSPKPQKFNLQVCKHQPFTLAPTNGDVFYFYEDPSLTQLIHKGRAYRASGIDNLTRFYYTNVDQLLESDTATIEIRPSDLDARIAVISDSILLEEAQVVEIANVSEHATTSFWLYETGTIDTTTILKENFQNVGNYHYTLAAFDAGGCSDTARQQITVYQITMLEGAENPGFSVYPNPTHDLLHIVRDEFSDAVELKLMDISGTLVASTSIEKNTSNASIQLKHLPPGTYVLLFAQQGRGISMKVIKQ